MHAGWCILGECGRQGLPGRIIGTPADDPLGGLGRRGNGAGHARPLAAMDRRRAGRGALKCSPQYRWRCVIGVPHLGSDVAAAIPASPPPHLRRDCRRGFLTATIPRSCKLRLSASLTRGPLSREYASSLRAPSARRAKGRILPAPASPPGSAASASGLGLPLPHLHWHWAHPGHTCTGTLLTPPTSLLGRS